MGNWESKKRRDY